jgi:hypothetical protein
MGGSRELRERFKSGLHGLFAFGQRLGVDILPRHFYSSIPDVRELRGSESWRKASSMVGVAGAELDPQMEFLRGCCSPHRERLRRGGIHEHACRENGEPGYGAIEAEFLYCFVAAKRPRKVVQVGAGVSTAVVLLAAEEAGYAPRVVCVDPFPTGYLKRMAAAKRIELVRAKAQEADLQVLTGIESGDLLFIDSSHATRPGSEVNRIILEVLPQLPAGCFVHFHDICFPYDYQPSVLSTLFFAGESSLLHAFLIHNRRYSIAVSLSMLHHGCPERMQSVLPGYRPAVMDQGLERAGEAGHFPSATYLLVSP